MVRVFEMQSVQPKNPVEAYILIKSELGQAWKVHELLFAHRKHKCKYKTVKLLSAYVVSGEYDVIAFLGGPTVKAIAQFVTGEIQLLHSSPDRLIRETQTAFASDWIPG